MQKSTILITGGSGYIGAHVGLFFAQKGFKIILLDQSHDNCHYQWATGISGSYGDSALLNSIFKSEPIDTIIHCDAFNTSKATNSLDHYQHYLVDTIRLIEQVRIHTIRKFILTSCASVYGNNSGTMDHDTTKEPINSHGKSTTMIETILEDSANTHAFSYIILRIFGVAGSIPDQQIIYPASSCNQTIASLMESVITNKPFYYYDTNHQTPDGSIINDYAHVWDVAHAHFAAYEYLAQHEKSDHFNIGSSRGISVKQLIEIAEKLFRKKIKTIVQKNTFADSPCLIANISKAIDLLNWQPSHSEIEFILKTAYKNFLN